MTRPRRRFVAVDTNLIVKQLVKGKNYRADGQAAIEPKQPAAIRLRVQPERSIVLEIIERPRWSGAKNTQPLRTPWRQKQMTPVRFTRSATPRSDPALRP